MLHLKQGFFINRSWVEYKICTYDDINCIHLEKDSHFSILNTYNIKSKTKKLIMQYKPFHSEVNGKYFKNLVCLVTDLKRVQV